MKKTIALTIATLATLAAHAATPHVEVKVQAFTLTASPTNQFIFLEPKSTASTVAIRSGRTDTSGSIIFSNSPAGLYDIRFDGVGGLPKLEIYIPDTSGVIQAVDYVTAASRSSTGWTNPVAAGGSGTFRGVPYLWPASQGSADSVLKNDGSGNLSWGQGGVPSDLAVSNLFIISNGTTNQAISAVGEEGTALSLGPQTLDWTSVWIGNGFHDLLMTNISSSRSIMYPADDGFEDDRVWELGKADARFTHIYTPKVLAGDLELELQTAASEINIRADTGAAYVGAQINFYPQSQSYYMTTNVFSPVADATRNLGLPTEQWASSYISNGFFSGPITVGSTLAASILQVTNQTTHFGLVTNHTTLRGTNIFNGGWLHNTGNLTNQGSLTITGAVTVPTAGGLKLGTGTTITNILSASGALTWTGVAAQTSQDQVLSVAGTTTNDVAIVTIPMQIGQQINCSFTCFTSNDNVWVRMNNYSSATRSTNGVVQVLVFKR